MRMLRTLTRLAPVIAVSLFLAGCGINTIPTQDEATKTAWAEVQNQYQRRADLIPNLVATVKGYAAQEKGVLTAVTEARASATQVKVDASTITDPAQFQQYAAAQDKLSGVLGRLMMIQESYPELKSNQNFLALQSQLEGTENRIAIARRDYNNTAQVYNTTLRTFPSIIWAKTLYGSQKPAQLFQATANAQSAPNVSFDAPAAPAVNTQSGPAQEVVPLPSFIPAKAGTPAGSPGGAQRLDRPAPPGPGLRRDEGSRGRAVGGGRRAFRPPRPGRRPDLPRPERTRRR
jgi:LemA protein